MVELGIRIQARYGPLSNRWSSVRLRVAVHLVAVAIALGVFGEPLRVGTNVWPGYEPLYLARELGVLDATTVKLVEFRSATQVIHALEAGSIDACALTLDEVITVAGNGTPMTVVLALDQSFGGDSIVAQPGLTSVSDLRGKRIGVEDTALGAFFFLRALEVSGMSLEDVQVVRMDVARHAKAFKRREIAASVCFEPTRSQLIAAGGVEVFDSRRIPGEIVDVLAVRSDLETSPASALRHLGAAWDEALAYMKSAPEKAYGVLGRRMGLDPRATRDAFGGVKLLDRKESAALLRSEEFQQETLVRLHSFMVERGLVDGSGMPRIAPEAAGEVGTR